MKLALVTYSTRPRGGVVHTLALAEALAEAGVDVTVVSLARHGDHGFFRRVDDRVTVSLVAFADINGETVGERIIRSIDSLRAGIDWSAFDIVHAQDCISANAVDRCVRTIHHIDHFSTPELVACHERAIVRPFAHICVSEAVAAEVRAGWGFDPESSKNQPPGDEGPRWRGRGFIPRGTRVDPRAIRTRSPRGSGSNRGGDGSSTGPGSRPNRRELGGHPGSLHEIVRA